MSVADDYDHEVDAFYRKSHGKVLGYLINMGTDRGLAEEITNDAFLVARRNWQRVRSSYRCPEGYIFMVARNERSKRQRRQDLHARDLHPDPQEPQRRQVMDPAQHIIDRIVLRTALQGLPERLREAVTLRHVADLSVETTAEIMGISSGTVKRYTSDGLCRLRSLIPAFRNAVEEGAR